MRSWESVRESLSRHLRLWSRLGLDAVRTLRPVLSRRAGEGWIELDLRDPRFNTRYTYLLTKFLLLRGYRVAFRFRPRLLLTFNELRCTAWLFREPGFHLAPFPLRSPHRRLTENPGPGVRVDMDYFRRLDAPDPGPEAGETVGIPMPMDPAQYASGAWRGAVPEAPRRNAAIFVGSLTGANYADDAPLALFGMGSRARQARAVLDSPLPVESDRPGEWRDGVVYLLDRGAAQVPAREWRSFLAGFRWFVGLPGQVMPLCHNVVEAMSVGTVPVLHPGYAALFDPPLRDGVEAMVQRDGEPLEGALERALALDPDQAADLSRAARAYYEAHLTPERVVPRMLAPEVREILFCAEGDSVAFLARRRGGAPPQNSRRRREKTPSE